MLDLAHALGQVHRGRSLAREDIAGVAPGLANGLGNHTCATLRDTLTGVPAVLAGRPADVLHARLGQPLGHALQVLDAGAERLERGAHGLETTEDGVLPDVAGDLLRPGNGVPLGGLEGTPPPLLFRVIGVSPPVENHRPLSPSVGTARERA